MNNLIQAGKTPRVTFVGYLTSKLFQTNYTYQEEKINCTNKYILSPNVISASEIDGIEPTSDLITIIYREQEYENSCDSNKVAFKFNCVFWDYKKNDWDQYGCTHTKMTRNGKIFHTCTCNHTTNFALLMVFFKRYFRIL